MEAAQERLSRIANNHNIPTLIVNCVGFCDNFESAGQSAVWDAQGHLLGQLKSFEEGMLFFDTKTKAINQF